MEVQQKGCKCMLGWTRLVGLDRLRATIQVSVTTITEMLYARGATVTRHRSRDSRPLMQRLLGMLNVKLSESAASVESNRWRNPRFSRKMKMEQYKIHGLAEDKRTSGNPRLSEDNAETTHPWPGRG